jgi:hypothetical protein
VQCFELKEAKTESLVASLFMTIVFLSINIQKQGYVRNFSASASAVVEWFGSLDKEKQLDKYRTKGSSLIDMHNNRNNKWMLM